MIFINDYIICDGDYQEELIDVSSTGRVRPWKEKRVKSLIVSKLYEDIDKRKADRVKDCATYVRFKVTSSFDYKLDTANFCRVRLCPVCIWRRSLKIFNQVYRVAKAVQEECQYEYLFLTLTVKNCEGAELSPRLDMLSYSWNKFLKRKEVKSKVKGWYKALEITHNLSENTYHPHYHCILAVDKCYFYSRSYLSQSKWTDLWKESLGVEYTPIVNVKKIKHFTAKVIAEMAKYTVKDSDYIRPEDWELSEEILRCLDQALNNRRLIAFGGVFKEKRKALRLDDPVDGDLVNMQEEQEEEDIIGYVSYEWNSLYQQYRRIEE